MNNIVFMHVRQTFTNLFQDICSLFLGCFLAFLDLGQISVRQVLKNQINVVVIVEISVHGRQVFVIKVHLDFELSDDMLLSFLLFYSLL